MRIVRISCIASHVSCISRTYHISRAAVQLADELTFTKELPLDWLPTLMYDKAAQMLERHKSGKSPQYHRVSGSEYLVLTTYGVDEFKKVAPKLVEWYRQAYQTHIMRISRTYHMYHTRRDHLV